MHNGPEFLVSVKSFEGILYLKNLGGGGAVKRTTLYILHLKGELFTEHDWLMEHGLPHCEQSVVVIQVSHQQLQLQGGLQEMDDFMKPGGSHLACHHPSLPQCLNGLGYCQTLAQCSLMATTRFGLRL